MAKKPLTAKTFKETLHVLAGNILPWLASVLVTAILGSLVQSSLSLVNVLEMGSYATLDDWRRTIAHDLLAFMPFYAAIVGTSFLLAFPAALWMAGKWPHHRTLLLATASVVGLIIGFFISNNATAVPTVILATRDATGYIAMLATGVIGAWVFALTSSRAEFVKAKGFSTTARPANCSKASTDHTAAMKSISLRRGAITDGRL